jgi:hypothetical protein
VRSRFVMMAAVAMAVTLALTDCARIVGQLDAQNAVKNAKGCAEEVWGTPEGQLLSARIWLGNETDTVRSELEMPLTGFYESVGELKRDAEMQLNISGSNYVVYIFGLDDDLRPTELKRIAYPAND